MYFVIYINVHSDAIDLDCEKPTGNANLIISMKQLLLNKTTLPYTEDNRHTCTP